MGLDMRVHCLVSFANKKAPKLIALRASQTINSSNFLMYFRSASRSNAVRCSTQASRAAGFLRINRYFEATDPGHTVGFSFET